MLRLQERMLITDDNSSEAILFPASFRLVLKSHLSATPRNRYLFETRRFGPFTTRRIQQIVQGYRETRTTSWGLTVGVKT